MSLRTTATIAVALILGGVLLMRASRSTSPSAVTTTATVVESDAGAIDAGSAGAKAFYAGKRPPVRALTELGRTLFMDRSLSSNGDRACETCHAPAFLYGPPPGAPAGPRAIPSLRYLQTVPRFALHRIEEDGTDQGPTGGFMWDGRAATAHDQARLPLLSETEMGNRTNEALAARIRASSAAAAVKSVFGDSVFASDERAISAVLEALEVFEQSPPDFAPYDSKYDAFLRGHVTLSDAEERGRVLFDNADKGNCASCHISHRQDGNFPVFTDWGFVALGVPDVGGEPADRGLCAAHPDLVGHAELCNMFRTPSLRNVARRDRFFHNGAVKNLTDVVRFYVTRDITPKRWQPADLSNKNMDPPFGKKTPALTETEIADVVTFLGTLTDGWKSMD